MKRLFGLFALLASAVAFAAEEPTDAGMINAGYVEKPAWFKEGFLDLREDVAEAASVGKGVMLYFYQDGCPYCERLINTNFAQQEISDATRSKFDVISINMWGGREVTDLSGKVTNEKDFSRAVHVQFTPTLLFLNKKGQATLRVNGYYPPHKFLAAVEYASGSGKAGESFNDYFARLNPTPASGKLHIEKEFMQPPYRLAQRNGKKPLLVLFEQKECPTCDELHGEAFRRVESRELLKSFDIAVIDIWSNDKVQTPAGKVTTAKSWARQLKVQYAPSMVFFVDGKEVFRTEAYLRPFHTQSALDYVASGAWRQQKEFQRYIEGRADELRAKGVEVDLWK